MKFLIIIALLISASTGLAQSTTPDLPIDTPADSPIESPPDSPTEPVKTDTVTVVRTPKSERAEFFYAPTAQKVAVQLTYSQMPIYRTQSSTLPSGVYANDVTTSSSTIGLRGQYSFTKNFALSLDLGYRKDQYEFSTTGTAKSARASGMKDIAVGTLYQLPTSFARYYFAVAGSLSQQRSELASISADGNETTGGWTLRPSLGMSKRIFVPSLRAGFELAQTIRGKRTQGDNQSPENDVTTTGGGITNLNLFTEFKFRQIFLVALRLSAAQIAQESIVSSGGTSPTGTAEAYSTYGIALDGFYYWYPWLTLKLGYEGTQLPARVVNDSAGTTQVYVSNFTVAARIVF